eukprot:3078016-Amphidinium_carterae.1
MLALGAHLKEETWRVECDFQHMFAAFGPRRRVFAYMVSPQALKYVLHSFYMMGGDRASETLLLVQEGLPTLCVLSQETSVCSATIPQVHSTLGPAASMAELFREELAQQEMRLAKQLQAMECTLLDALKRSGE